MQIFCPLPMLKLVSKTSQVLSFAQLASEFGIIFAALHAWLPAVVAEAEIAGLVFFRGMQLVHSGRYGIWRRRKKASALDRMVKFLLVVLRTSWTGLIWFSSSFFPSVGANILEVEDTYFFSIQILRMKKEQRLRLGNG